MLLKRYFEETWPAFPAGPVDFAILTSAGMHDPVQFGLEPVATLMTRSSRIILNTYNDAAGSRKAVGEFLESHPGIVMERGVTPILRRR